ncbi:MAG: efflux RND transporter periplasmic adaptor subunit [Candidatus Altimarinota bacterium]
MSNNRSIFRVILYILLFLGVAVIAVYLLNQAISSTIQADQDAKTSLLTTEQTADQPAETPSSTEQPPTSASNTGAAFQALDVTVINLSKQEQTFLNSTATVKAKNQISLFPATSGTVQKLNVQEGDFVKANQVIAELTGANQTTHPSYQQFLLAQNNLATAKSNLQSAKANYNEGNQTARLQLQSAINQANAIQYDLQQIEQNQLALQQSLNIMEENLDLTQDQADFTNDKTRDDIDDLIYKINDLQDEKARLLRQINDLPEENNDSEQTPDPQNPQAPTASPQELLEQQLGVLNGTLEELYNGLDQTKYGYEAAGYGQTSAQNQVISQINQTRSQLNNAELTLLSTTTKLGYTGDSSDALKLAEQGYKTTQIQLNSSLNQAESAYQTAQINYQLAQDSLSGLQIRSPISGQITSLDLIVGQTISPQSPAAEVVDNQSYQAVVQVSESVATQIKPNAKAKVYFGNRQIEVPVVSVSSSANAQSKLVEVKLALPNISFRNNQTLNVELPISPTVQLGTNQYFLPLDAVIIGSRDQFVFVNENNQAVRRPVKLGTISGDLVQILEGLQPSDQVILQGAKQLVEGQPIIISQ